MRLHVRLKPGLAGLLKGVAGLIFLASCSAFAQEQPEQVYLKLHRAMLAGNAEEVMSYATLAKRAEMKNMPGRDAVIKMMAGLTPKAYTVNSRVFNPDGKTARLIASGMGEFMGSHSMMYGTINFLREEGQWRVEQWEWGNQKPAAFPVAKPAAPAVPAAPAAAAPTTPARQAASAPPEESKLARQEARKKAREEAEEKRIADAKAKAEADQKAYEARWKDCVIMPVMSDDELRKCGVTVKR
jgi:hypothetical protein